MGTPIRFPFGVTNVAKTTAFGECQLPVPLDMVTYFEDFLVYQAGQWTITNVGTTPTQAMTDASGGALRLTTVASASSSTFLQKTGSSWGPVAGKKFMFQSRLRTSNVLDTILLAGVQVTDTTPLDATDGIYFVKPTAASASVNLICRKDATTGSISATGVASMVNDTFIALGYAYDGKRTLTVYVDNEPVTSIDLTADPTAFLPDVLCRTSFGLENGGSTSRTADFDYIFIAQER